MKTIVSGDPIGQVHEEHIKGFVQELAKQWLVEKEQIPKKRWWQFWKNPQLMHKAVKFLIDSLDVIIKYIDDLLTSGPDKKATVIAAAAALYDLIVVDLLPIWLKPFASGVKTFIIYTIVSLAIDFIVKHYRDGSWNKGADSGTEQPKAQL